MGGVRMDIEKDAQEYLDSFKIKMKKIADECMAELYVNCLPYVETDAWINYRETLRLEIAHEYKYSKFRDNWAKDLRRAILVENKEELISLLNQDLVERCKRLEEQVKEFEQFRYF